MKQASDKYEKPEAQRLGDGRVGEGVTCTGPGSSDSWCETGNSATAFCVGHGNSASQCSNSGNEQLNPPSNWRD